MSMDSSNKLAQLEELEGEEYQQIMTFLEEALFEGLRQEGIFFFLKLFVISSIIIFNVLVFD